MLHSTHIQGRIQISNELKRRKLGQEPMKGRELIEETHKVDPETPISKRTHEHWLIAGVVEHDLHDSD